MINYHEMGANEAPSLLEIQREQSFIRGVIGESTLYLTDLFVPPEQRRAGMATQLLSEAVDRARKTGMTRVMGDITTRQCLDLVTSFFGPDAVKVVFAAEYDGYTEREEVPTVATLDYEIMAAPSTSADIGAA